MEDIARNNRSGGIWFEVPPVVIILTSFLTFGAQTFGYMESQLLNTFISHVLHPINEALLIAVMVSCSAIMGLVFMFVFGIISDNTRSRFGRRRPFLLVGGIVMGVGMILFGFSPNYLICFIIDVILIGISSNLYYSAQRVLVPDFIKKEYRGRVNGFINIVVLFGIIFPVILTLFAPASLTVPDPGGTGKLLTRDGHILLLSIGGIMIISCGILGFAFLPNSVGTEDLPEKESFTRAIKSTFNFAELKHHSEFFKLISANTILMAGSAAIMSYLFVFIFSIAPEVFDLIVILGIAAPSLVISIILLGKLTDKIGRKKVIPPAIIISCLGFFMVPFLVSVTEINFILLGIAFSLVLVGVLGLQVPLNAWCQDLLPEEKRGQFFGIFNVVNTLSQVLGTFASALVITLIDGIVTNPKAWIFAVAPVFFLLSLPIFLTVKETLILDPHEGINPPRTGASP
ncbi:MAG: MFS transporter [Promethearchaeota archaeon]